MYFLVQSNIYSDPDHYRVFEALESLGIEYKSIFLDYSKEHLELSLERNDVFVYGSVKLARLCKQFSHWRPGSFYGGNHLYEVYAQHYQQHLLNYGVELFQLSQKIAWKSEELKFIKPYKDAKIFTGRVFSQSEWEEFAENALENPPTPAVNAQTWLQASTPQHIIKEARLWIVGGQIVEAVYYRFYGNIPFESEVAGEGLQFAREMIALFEVAEAFVMDICLTTSGWKIVEINCINSAGFYPNANVSSVFRALQVYFSDF